MVNFNFSKRQKKKFKIINDRFASNLYFISVIKMILLLQIIILVLENLKKKNK